MRYTLQVFIAAVGIFASAVAASGKPPSSPAVAVPRVVDANNNVVGDVVGAMAEPRFPYSPLIAVVAMNISGRSIIVQVTPNRFWGNARLYFTEPTCSVGQAYFDEDAPTWGNNLFPIVGAGSNPAILYTQRANSAPVAFPLAYSWTLDENHRNGVCTLSGVTSGYIADPLVDLSTQFTPPYRFVYP